MTADGVDLAKVRSVLQGAVKPAGPFSQRGLARKAGLDRDAVYDLVQGRNRNPSLKVLAALAEAMGKDLSVFGIGARATAPSAEELHAVLLEVLPEMPRRASLERKAAYLAEAVAAALRLPPTAKARRSARRQAPRRGAAAPPPSPTNRA
jgi:transcriptional regulator with XRE-family HTH domain